VREGKFRRASDWSASVSLARNRQPRRLRSSPVIWRSLPSLTVGLLTQKTPTDQRSDPKSLLISNVSTLQSGNEI